MTTCDVLRALARRRLVVLAGAVVTTIALVLVSGHPGVYWGQANVVFLAPSTSQNPNALQSTTSGLISTAGYVERLVNAGVEKPATASQVTLLGQGVRDGYSIGLPDVGGQWSHNFDQAILNVQATGPNATVVRDRLDRLIQQIRSTTSQMQARDNVAAADLIRTDVSPAVPRVSYATGSRLRALAGTLVLGIAATVFLSVLADRWLIRRRVRSAISLPPPQTKTTDKTMESV